MRGERMLRSWTRRLREARTGHERRGVAYGVAGLAAGVLLGTLPTGAYGMAQAPAVPVPVETLQTSTLWQAAEASYAAEAPGGSPFLVHTSAIRRWAKSPTANTDLLTAFDMPLEALGHFTWAPYPEVEAAFVANMAASHPGPVARAVLTGLIALGHDPRNLPVVAETLFPGPEGLNRLIADAHFYGTFQGALPGLLKAYGLSGSAGVSYATHHP